MSKSKGNVVDPLEVMDQYGTDAVRFTLAIMAAPGTDISLSQEKLMSYRAFANKIWNASRFVLMNLESIAGGSQSGCDLASTQEAIIAGKKGLTLADRWILSRLNQVIRETNRALESYRFHEASYHLYHFFWHELCDWYLELIKPKILDATGRAEHALSFSALVYVFDQAMKLLHPFMPFITEELWQRLPHQGASLAVQDFPKVNAEMIDEEAERQMAILEDVIIKIRNVRAEMDVEPGKRIHVNLASPDSSLQVLLKRETLHIQNLARCSQVDILPAIREHEHSARRVASGVEIEIPLAGLIDFEAEKAKLVKEIGKVEKDVSQIRQKLSNPNFVANAPGDVVRLNQERLADLSERLGKLNENLQRL